MRPNASENSQISPQPWFGLPELLVASHISRLASRDAAKSLLSTLVSESSEECRFVCLQAAKTCWLATDSANFNVRSTWANFGASERAAFRGSAFLDANRILRSGEAGHELLKSIVYRWAHDQAT